jgi:hypothetical protein
MIEPAGENRDGGRLDVDELEAHADSGLDDADHSQGFNAFAFACQGDAGAGFYGKRLAGADEAATKGEVGGDAFRAGAGFEIEDFGIGGERISDGVTAVAEASFARHTIGCSVVHGDNVAHSQEGRGIASRDEAEERSPLCNKGAREGGKIGEM